MVNGLRAGIPVSEDLNRFPKGIAPRFLFAYMALFLPFAIATPYLQALLRLRGFERDEIGLILGCLEAMAVLAPPLWGALSDHLGMPKVVLLAAIVGCFPTFLLFGFVKALPGAILCAFLFGCFYRPLIPLTDGLTFRFIRVFGGDYGQIRIGGSIAFILSVVLLERIGIAHSRSGGLIVGAMGVALCVQLFSVLFIPSSPGPGFGQKVPGRDVSGKKEVFDVKSSRRLLLSRGFLCFMLCAFLGRLSMMSYYGFFTLYLKEAHGFEQVGYIWLLGPLSEMPVMFYSRRIMDRIGVKNLFVLGLLGCALRLYGFSLASAVWMIIPLQLLHSLTFGAYHTASVTYVSRVVPPGLQSTAQSIFAAVTVGTGGILGGALGGVVARHLGFTALYGIFGTIAAVSLILLLVLVPSLAHPVPEPGSGALSPK